MKPPEYWHGPTDSRYWNDVNEGDKLSIADYPVTVNKLIMSGMFGTHDAMPYHNDREYTQKSTPARDAFITFMWRQALIGRMCTDWSGPESDVRGMSNRLHGDLCPHDTLNLDGTVVKKYRDGDDHLVDIEVTETNQLGQRGWAKVTLAMPVENGDVVQPRLHLEKPKIDADPAEMPEFAREWLGKVSEPVWGGYPVSDTQIMHWCDMVEDGNPLYVDCEYARKGRYEGMIAPLHSLWVWNYGRVGWTGVNPEAPDAWAPHRKPWPPKPQKQAGIRFKPPGATDSISTQIIQTYGPPLRPGDRVYKVTEFLNCSQKKSTRMGEGYFLSQLESVYNQRDELAGFQVFQWFAYGVNSSKQ